MYYDIFYLSLCVNTPDLFILCTVIKRTFVAAYFMYRLFSFFFFFFINNSLTMIPMTYVYMTSLAILTYGVYLQRLTEKDWDIQCITNMRAITRDEKINSIGYIEKRISVNSISLAASVRN